MEEGGGGGREGAREGFEWVAEGMEWRDAATSSASLSRLPKHTKQPHTHIPHSKPRHR